MSLNTPAARRDQAFHLHPVTNLREVQNEGPVVMTRGRGIYVYDDEGSTSRAWPGSGARRSDFPSA